VLRQSVSGGRGANGEPPAGPPLPRLTGLPAPGTRASPPGSPVIETNTVQWSTVLRIVFSHLCEALAVPAPQQNSDFCLNSVREIRFASLSGNWH